jgi:hypothetical protein
MITIETECGYVNVIAEIEKLSEAVIYLADLQSLVVASKAAVVIYDMDNDIRGCMIFGLA